MHFKTVSNVTCASIEELQKVPKIGKKKAELIYRIFRARCADNGITYL